MTRRYARFILFLGMVALAAMPLVAQAAPSWIPIVPCGSESAGQSPCTPCDVFATVKNLIDLVLYGITGPIAAFMIVFSGGMMLVSGFNRPALYAKGKAQIYNTLIGVTIILLSWISVNFLIKSIAPGNEGNRWYEFSCPSQLALISEIQKEFSNVPYTPPKQVTPVDRENMAESITSSAATEGVALGAPIARGDVPLDKLCLTTCPRSGFSSNGMCPNYKIYTDKYATGIITSNFLQSMAAHESSCGRNKVGPEVQSKKMKVAARAYGPTQMQIGVARANVGNCKVKKIDSAGNETLVPVNKNDIDAGWLMSDVNLDAIFCITANLAQALIGQCGNDLRNIAAGWNGGDACRVSRDCAGLTSCSGGAVLRWECPWDNPAHTAVNEGYQETRKYAPSVAACAQ